MAAALTSSTATGEATEPELRFVQYLTVLRRRWWAVVFCALFGAGTAYGFAAIQTPQYEATTQIALKNLGATGALRSLLGIDPSRPDPQGVATQIAFIKTRPVLELASEKLVEQGFADGLTDVELAVTSVPNINLINIGATSPSPAKARAASRAVTDAYFEKFQRQVLEELSTLAGESQKEIVRIQADVDRLEAEIDDLEYRLAAEAPQATGQATTASPAARDISDRLASRKAERDQKRAQLALLQGNIDELQRSASLRSQSLSVFVAPDLPTTPVSPKPVRSGVVGLIVGLFAGAGLAFVLEFLDDSIRSRADAERSLGLQPLGFIPKVEDWKREDDPRVATIEQPESGVAEAFRTLRTNVRFAALSQGAQVLMISSPAAKEGKSFVAVNLAVVASQAGQRVILLDADLRKPRIHRFTSLSNDDGLTTAMLGEKPLVDLLRRPRWETVPDGLDVMTSGPIPPNPSELLGLRQVADLIETLRARADLVVVDSAPALPVTDAAVLAANCDASLMVVRSGMSSQRAARRAIEQFEAVGSSVLGFVLNAASAESAELPSYYYYYAYRPDRERRSGLRRLVPRRREKASQNGPAKGSARDRPEADEVLVEGDL